VVNIENEIFFSLFQKGTWKSDLQVWRMTIAFLCLVKHMQDFDFAMTKFNMIVARPAGEAK
jgi:hypothetical protein